MMTTTNPRPLSVAELQSALDAAWGGEFAEPGRGQSPETGESGADDGGGRTPQLTGRAGGRPAPTDGPSRGLSAPHAAALPGSAVLVLAGHAGAGASTVALLIGEAAATAGARARVIECADPARSGVAAATDAELGDDGAGWRRGRRGALEVDRLCRHVGDVEDVAAPRLDRQASVTVVDGGWAAWDILAATSWVSSLQHTAQLVLVCRATVPGVRQTEQLLSALPGRQPLIAAVGAAKWPGVVSASCGPLLRSARAEDRIVAIPLDRQLDVTGVTGSPLPKQLTAAGRALASQLFTDLPAPTHRQRRAD